MENFSEGFDEGPKPSLERIKKFRSDESYRGWRQETAWLGDMKIGTKQGTGFVTSIFDMTGNMVSNGYCFRVIGNHTDYMTCATRSVGIALANAGIEIGNSIANAEDLDEIPPQLAQDGEPEPTITEKLRAGKV